MSEHSGMVLHRAKFLVASHAGLDLGFGDAKINATALRVIILSDLMPCTDMGTLVATTRILMSTAEIKRSAAKFDRVKEKVAQEFAQLDGMSDASLYAVVCAQLQHVRGGFEEFAQAERKKDPLATEATIAFRYECHMLKQMEGKRPDFTPPTSSPVLPAVPPPPLPPPLSNHQRRKAAKKRGSAYDQAVATAKERAKAAAAKLAQGATLKDI